MHTAACLHGTTKRQDIGLAAPRCDLMRCGLTLPRRLLWLAPPTLLLALFIGCWSPRGNEVVVYSALDREFSEPVLSQFERRTNIEVRAKYDVESTKTLGLVTRIIQEKDRPGCDVFWNNEILHTVRLEKLGLLKSYAFPRAGDFPPEFRSAGGNWYGLAARARVLVVNRNAVSAADRPKSIEDLADPKWKGRVGIAKPLFGTTATHAAVLFAAWGETRSLEFFDRIKSNSLIMSGNKQVASAVGRGQLAFGLTDTDDALVELEQGQPVEIVFPDQGPSGIGTLFIPNTIAIVRGTRHESQAEKLVDFLLSPEVEQQLAKSGSAQIPLNSQVKSSSRVLSGQNVKWMQVDFAAAAEAWEKAWPQLRDRFASGN